MLLCTSRNLQAGGGCRVGGRSAGLAIGASSRRCSSPKFDPALAGLEIPEQLRGRGLILENADGFAPDPTVRFVLRSVPHSLSMGVSVTRGPADPVPPPAARTGWSGDGAPGAGTLRDSQSGAIVQHYTRRLDRIAGEDLRLAGAGELDGIELFMRESAARASSSSRRS